MADSDDQLAKLLDGYAAFRREKDLALPKHQPYLVRWVRDLYARRARVEDQGA